MLKFFLYRISYIFYFFIFTIFVLFILLVNGIKIDSFEFDNFKIDGFFLQYNKKLILDIKNITITLQNDDKKSNDDKQSNDGLDIKSVNYIDKILASFEHIKIKNIKIKKYNIFIEYLAKQNYFKIIINNKLFINTRLSIQDNILSYQMKAKLKDNLDFLFDFIKIDKELKNSISFKSINLSDLNGKLDLTKIDKVKPLLLIPTITIIKPKLSYPNAPIVAFDEIKINLKDGKIITQFKNDKDINNLSFVGDIGTSLDFKNINLDGILTYDSVKIDIKTDIFLDKIYKIKAHYVNMIKNKLYFKGDIELDPKTLKSKDGIKMVIDNFYMIFDENLMPVKAKKVDFLYKNDDILLSFTKPTCDKLTLDGTKVAIKNLSVLSKTTLFLNLKSKELLQDKLLAILKYYGVDLPLYQSKGKNDIKVDIVVPFSSKNKTKFDVKTKINSKNSKIKFKDIDIDIKTLSLNSDLNFVNFNSIVDNKKQNLYITNTIDLTKKLSYGTAKINKFLFYNLIDIKNETIKYNIDLKNNLRVDIPKYNIVYKMIDDTHTVNISNFEKMVKFIKPFDISIKSKSKFQLKTNNNFKTTTININNLYLKTNKDYIRDFNKNSDDKNSKNDKKTKLPKIDIRLKDGQILYDNYSLFYSRLNLNLVDSKIDAKCTNQKTEILTNIDIDKKTLAIKSDEISSSFVNILLGKRVLKDGFITLNTKGTFKQQQGVVVFVQTTIQNVQVINNLILFINTTPAIINPLLALPTLFRLGESGFDTQGYYTNGGWVEFNYEIDKEFFYFKDFNTNGKMVDFMGRGLINLKTKDIGFNLVVAFLKDYSKFISHIPLLGYIMVGDSGDFVTKVDITGTTKNPKFETHMVKNATQGVGNMLKRIILSPAHLIKNITNAKPMTKEEKALHEKRVKKMLGN